MFGIELLRSFRPKEIVIIYPARWAGLTYSRPFGPYFLSDLEGVFGIEVRRSFRPWGGHECLPSPLGWADILSALWALFSL